MSTEATAVSSSEQKPGGTLIGYMPQLDGLRALAVLAVWFEHWGLPPIPGLNRIHAWGGLGVFLFFVLSGFLITGILLRGRQAMEQQGIPLWEVTRTFYIRRFLRILPVYYAVLFATAIALPNTRRLFWWHFTYTTNLWYGVHWNDYVPGAHFWSLAVEEQFYLVWPWLVLLTPRRLLLKSMIWIAIASAVYRLGYIFQPWHKPEVTTMIAWSLGNFDRLAMGSILAVLWEAGDTQRIRRFCTACLWLGLVGEIAMQIIETPHQDNRLVFALQPVTAALLFTWLVNGAARGFRGPFGWVLRSRPMLYLGRISYGVYLLHIFTPPLLKRAHIHVPDVPWIKHFPVLAAVTLALASISWFALERPINQLKRYFTYRSNQHDVVIAGAI
jgi:peptidoglycan/LPS O-acetylase OafA/YrhL